MEKRYHYYIKNWLILNLTLGFIAFIYLPVHAQTSFTKHWEHSFGSKSDDFLWDVQPTNDGGVIMAGESNSGVEGGKSQANKNFFEDIWVVKLDAQGNKQWDKTLGGTYGDEPRKVRQTSDGGYIIFGQSWSEVSGDKSEPCRGRPDYWILKLDANGNKEWDSTYGGDDDEMPEDLEITPDGGFILAGKSDSRKSGDKTDSLGFRDYWLVKVDSKGNKSWDKSLVINHQSEIRYFNQTADKGYLVSGFYVPVLKDKSGQDSTGLTDFWLIKLDDKGNEVWNKHYGTETYDFLMSVQQTSEGGYMLGGTTKSFKEGKEQEDCLIMKLDRNGNKIWEKSFGTSLDETLRTIQQLPDKGYIVAGFSGQEIDDYDDIYLSWQSKFYWVTKLDMDGNKVWEEKFEIPNDKLSYLIQLPDKGYLISGSYSRKDETQSEEEVFDGAPRKRIHESWIVKLNSMGKKQWSTRVSRKLHYTFDTPELTKDGGFILWGQEFPEQDEADYWIVKFRPEGAVPKIPGSSSEIIHEKVDQMPVFPGKETALNAYFLKALAGKIYFKGGIVTLKLVIDKSGQPKSIEVLSGLNQETDAMVVEIARKMPKWQPGKQKGQPVSVRINIQVILPTRAEVAINENIENKEEAYVFQEPSFPGGPKALQAFLDKNIKYPANAKANKIEGQVDVSFIVRMNGNIADPVIIKSVFPEIDVEALRLVKSLPAWIPGKQDGMNVNSRVTIPIIFRLSQIDKAR